MRGAIFDVDGTLLDSMGIWKDAGKRYLADLGKEAEKDLNDILFPMTMEESASYLKKRYGLAQDEEEIARGIHSEVEDFYRNEAQLKAGAAELLAMLDERGIAMTVATSNERMHVEAAFERLDITGYFKEILTCSEVGRPKSDPLIFERAAEIMGTERHETFVFEDGLYAIVTAKNAGFRTVGVFDDSSMKDRKRIEETADICLGTLRDIIEMPDALC